MLMFVLLHCRFSVVQCCAMLALMTGVAICSYSRSPASDTHVDEAPRTPPRPARSSCRASSRIACGTAARQVEHSATSWPGTRRW
ncbi:hypothetical protein PR001_g7608 [Phytophthora rubi]|uniref:Secreted protein n=1 Tax=Phytophthora rubi TaxID=129364 RepID=A0A6A3N6E7_9STRA|nr:hypothetical protein PR001_g7608 [Phytophthora rubi]